jgi:hypothetical protein
MTAKSIIDIDVQDAAFKDFIALFNKYNDQLKKMPGAWGKVSKASTATAESTHTMEESLQNIAESNRRIADYMAKFQKASKESDTSWNKIAKTTKTVAGNIAGMTRSLLRIAGVGGILGGLVGAGSLFGLDRLSSSASRQSRGASGLNITPGEQNAFGINYRQYVNPDSFLGNVNEALQDRSKRWSLYSAGLTEGQINGKSTAEVAAMLIPLIRQKFIQGGRTQQGAQAFGLTQFGGLQDLNRLANASPQELALAKSHYEVDKKNLDLSKETTSAWIELNRQLSRAGTNIENTFVRALAPLAPSIAKLSNAFSEAINTLSKNGTFKKWVDDFSDGIKTFATYIGSKEFQTDVSNFATGIAALGKAVYGALQFFNLIPDTSKVTDEASKPQAQGKDPIVTFDQLKKQTGFAGPSTYDILASVYHRAIMKTSAGKAYYSGIEKKFGLPEGFLYSVENSESSFNPLALSKKGAMGAFQMMAPTARAYNVNNPWNPDEASYGAGQMYSDLKRHYKGDIRKAIAAYNFGQGNLDKEIAQYGSKWEQHLPAETSGYLNRVSSGIRVEVNNMTGGSAVISTQQLAH